MTATRQAKSQPPPPDRRAGRREHRSRVGGWPIAVVGLVLVLVAYTLRYTLVPFVFALVIGFVLDPVVDWSTRWTRGHRWPMAVVLTILIVGGCGFGAYWAANTAFHDLSKVAPRLPDMIQHAVAIITGPQGVTFIGTHYAPQQITSLIITGATNVFNAAAVLLALKISLGTVAAVVMTFVLIPYFLISGPRLAEGALWLVPPERQRPVREMLPKLIPMLRRYAAGLCGVVAYAGGVAYAGLGILFHVPAAELLSLVIGFLELIPVIGPITSIVLVGLSAAQIGTFTAIFLVLYALALRLSIDNLVGPLLLGQAVTIHPVVVIFAFVTGAVLFGVIGLLLAVPTAASIKLILEYYYSEPIVDDEPLRLRERGAS